MKRIALVGDYSESVVAHRAIPIALKLAVEALKADVSWEWLHSRTLQAPEPQLDAFAGVWCVPGSPYENTQGVLDAIRFARLAKRPFLGTCGGFQHAVIEYAQSVWGIDAVHHAELDPNATNPVIAPLVCALREVRGGLHFEPGSRLRKIYDRDSANEEYHCGYGFNEAYLEKLQSGPLKIAARDDEGSVRAVELDGHPFFIGTLFQPERAALRDQTPPLVKAFVAAVASS